MGLIDDILGSDIVKDAVAIRKEFDDFKQEVTSAVVESATTIKTTLDDSAEQLADTAADVADIVHKATDINQ